MTSDITKNPVRRSEQLEIFLHFKIINPKKSQIVNFHADVTSQEFLHRRAIYQT